MAFCTFQQHQKAQNDHEFHFALNTCSLNTTNETGFLAFVCARIYTLVPVTDNNNDDAREDEEAMKKIPKSHE
jgi:hypothetical protein